MDNQTLPKDYVVNEFTRDSDTEDFLPVFSSHDFDEASKAWLRNKKRLKEGGYKYVCSAIKTNGTICQNDPANVTNTKKLCRDPDNVAIGYKPVPRPGFCVHHAKKMKAK